MRVVCVCVFAGVVGGVVARFDLADRVGDGCRVFGGLFWWCGCGKAGCAEVV